MRMKTESFFFGFTFFFSPNINICGWLLNINLGEKNCMKMMRRIRKKREIILKKKKVNGEKYAH